MYSNVIPVLGVLVAVGSGTWLWTGGPVRSPEEAFSKVQELSAEEETARLIEACRKILVRDATAPARWSDLAEALEQAGDVERARYCFERALAYGPNQPPIWLRAAEFDVRTGRSEEALAKLGRILKLVEEYDPVVFEIFDAMPFRAEELLGRGLPAMPRPARAWLRHQIATGERAGAEATWRWMGARGLADDALAGEYAEFLIRQGRPEQAARSWSEHLGPRRGDYRQANYLFNGDFECPPAGGPFDWRIAPVAGAEASIEAGEGYAGLHALKLRFLGEENLDYRHVTQKAVLPAGRWRLEAWVRSEELSTNEGLRLRAVDAANPDRLDAVSEAVTGSTKWRKLAVDFAVPSGSRLVEIQIVRRASLKLDNKIRGTAWIDAVRLEPLG